MCPESLNFFDLVHVILEILWKSDKTQTNPLAKKHTALADTLELPQTCTKPWKYKKKNSPFDGLKEVHDVEVCMHDFISTQSRDVTSVQRMSPQLVTLR